MGEDLMERLPMLNGQQEVMYTDNFPVITCAGKNRTPEVATTFVLKGYCTAKDLYFYGLRLHTLN
jgi:hypothetical protein